MKKFVTGFLLVAVGIVIGLAAALTVFYFTGSRYYEQITGKPGEAMPAISSQATSAELTAFAFEIVGCIKENDYDKLSQVIHPEYGVVFSPYATLNLASNKCFTANQVKAFLEDQDKYVWGKYDGSGNPIELTPADYFKSFVFDKDYTLASKIGVDTIINSGNSLENIRDVFPNARFVDFYMPGADAELDGLDWSSLRLGFEEYNGQLKLTVILHSQWTI